MQTKKCQTKKIYALWVLCWCSYVVMAIEHPTPPAIVQLQDPVSAGSHSRFLPFVKPLLRAPLYHGK